MPRTKVPKDKKEKTMKKPDKQKELLLKTLEEFRDEVCTAIDAQLAQILDEIEVFDKSVTMKIPKPLLEKTPEEMETIDNSDASNIHGLSTFSRSNTTRSVLNSTKKPTLKRTSSFDEGYTTAESTSNSGVRASRSRVKTAKVGLSTSQSLTRSNLPKSTMKTPANKQPPRTAIGTITPKVQQNTPQILVRRPKQGEMALSYQGSPVLTGPLVCEDRPNINIPLPNGDLLALQSQRGLRVSQIPDFDDETRRHLEILKDNLLKLCAK